MRYKVLIEGQEFEMEEDIAGDDSTLKSALTPYFPGASNAKIMRSTPKDDLVTVTVIKQAGTKGARQNDGKEGPEDQVLRKLIESREGMNPVYEINRNMETKTLNQMSIEELIDLDKQIEKAIDEGRQERDSVHATMKLLINTEPRPSSSLIIGF